MNLSIKHLSFVLVLVSFTSSVTGDEVKLRRYIRSLNPYQQAYNSQCPDFVKEIVDISVDGARTLAVENVAHQIVMNWKNLRIMLERSDVVLKNEDIAAGYFAVDPIPPALQAEVHQTEILKIMRELLDIENNVSYEEAPKYTLGTLSRCTKSSVRLANNTFGCPFASDTQMYGSGGRCTNPNRPASGAAFRAYRHIAEPECKASCPECQSHSLPSARDLSLTIADIKFSPMGITNIRNRPGDPNHLPNTFILGLLQLHIHDIMQQKFKGNEFGHRPLTMCANDQKRPLSYMIKHPDTMCVKVDESDYFYGTQGVSCLPVNKAHQLNEDCTIETPGTLNWRAPLLTLAPIYERLEGNEYVFNNHSNGKLIKDANGLPLITDPRSMQHATLTAAHYFWGLLHDRIVDALVASCPKMNAWNRFIRARQLNIMFYQYIMYDDILRVLVGDEVTKSRLHSDFNTFDSNVEPTILSEYACAASRYIHIFIPDDIFLMNSDATISDEFLFSETVNNPNIVTDFASTQKTVQGTACFPWNFQLVSEEIQSKMFADGKPYGSDLISMDIMRGRDCCLKPYIHYLDIFNGTCVKDWSDLKRFMSDFAVSSLEWIFRSYQDVDLYTGGSSETNTDPEAKMTPTFKRITVEQYKLLKNGDPKWWNRITTSAQRQMIKSLSFGDLLCITLKLQFVPRDAKMAWSASNPLVECRCTTFESCFNIKDFLGSKCT